MHTALAELLGGEIVPGGLTGRALTWTVRGVGSIPKSVFSLKWMYDEYLHLLRWRCILKRY